jgi:hypothetical protein
LHWSIRPKAAVNFKSRLDLRTVVVVDSKLKPIYLFADSQLLFWEDELGLFLGSLTRHLGEGLASSRSMSPPDWRQSAESEESAVVPNVTDHTTQRLDQKI